MHALRHTPPTGYRALVPLMFPPAERLRPPPMRAPITYVIDYSRRPWDDPGAIRSFADSPPDLMHVGKTVPILHNWGPVPLLHGENQATGGPGHTLDRKAISLLPPRELAARIAQLKAYTRRWHAAGVPRLLCYSAIHTIAGDHETREGFWAFYDRWSDYARWLGPRPASDPFTWLSVGRDGKFLAGSCGGFSPPYYAPFHRYRTCPEHPEWRRFQATLTRLIAGVGYDGVFPDNSSPWEIDCFCAHCRRNFRAFVAALPSADLRTLGCVGDPQHADLLSEATPKELIRRYRIATVARWQRLVREAGREVTPAFEVFPNVNSFADFMAISASCDEFMFESTYPPGARLPLARLRNPAGIPAAQAHATHIGQLLFSVHSPARAVLLDYACRKPGQEAMQELGMAQCAAFGNGAALAALGEPLRKNSGFFKRAAALYDGAEPYADIGLLYAFWGQNPGNMWRPGKAPSPAEVLAGRHRLIRTVMDRSLSANDLAGLKSIVVCAHALELSGPQIAAIRQFVARGGALCVFKPETSINGRPLVEVFGSAVPWSAVLKVPGHRPVIAARGMSRGLRFNTMIHRDCLRLVLHAVNYSVDHSGRRATVARAPGVQVRLTLPTGWEATSVMAHDPDKSAARKVACKQRGRTLVLGLPSVHIYCVVEIACRFVDSPAGGGLPARRE